MTQELLKYQENNLLFVDIETARANKDFNEEHPMFEAFQWKQRNRDTDEIPDTPTTIKLYKEKAALDPVYGKVVCITVGFLHNNKLFVQTFSGDEKQLLSDFVEFCNSQDRTLCLWNAVFDLPYVRQRSFINKLGFYLKDTVGNDSMKKPWTLKGVLDLMDVWRGISFRNSSLEETALAMGLPSPKNTLRGSEVSQAYHDGRIKEIVSYCEQDVLATANLYRLFTYQEPVTEIVIKTPEKLDNLPLLERIKKRGHITEADQKELDSKSKDIDPQVLEDILSTLK